MVGALSRFNVNHEQLLPQAKRAAQELGLKAPCHNPYMITVAQFVELFHIADEGIRALIVTLEYDGTSSNKNESIIPFLKYAKAKELS